jgi:hypothetical protein
MSALRASGTGFAASEERSEKNFGLAGLASVACVASTSMKLSCGGRWILRNARTWADCFASSCGLTLRANSCVTSRVIWADA